MKQAKKIINDPNNVATELLEGLIEAYHGKIKAVEEVGVKALVKTSIPEGKVALLIGGGSGHEPVFHGFIGDNLADGAACGDIFAAPTPDVIFAVTKAIHRGNGVLYAYNNYAGDVMNFDIAAEMAADAGIEVKTVLNWDDVASAPPDNPAGRRGIAGDVFFLKIAGAAAATARTLDEAVRITTKARDNLRSMGVALAAGSIPQTGEPTFELPEDEIEIGMGLHGEPGVSRGKMLPADLLVETMLDKILADLPFQRGDEVALLINDLGSTTMMELLIVNRKVRQILREKGISVHDTAIGGYCTCQEMAGFSISLLKLDAELKKYYDLPASSFGYVKR